MAKTRGPESGFALLLIFCLAAIVGVMLYAATPRVAFEAQRDQEQLLIDRGEQYKRAIQLYFRAFKRYPAKMEDLENTANQRFLRRRYDDPITGKSEWRLIHVGPGGVLLDSVNKAPKKPGGREGSVNTFITELPALGAAPGTGVTQGLAQRRRPSDQPLAPGSPVENGAPLDEDAIANAAAEGVATSTPSPFGPDGRPLPPGAPAYSGYPNPTGAYAALASQPQTPAAAVQQPGPPGPAGNNAGAQMIQRLLTSPRPGGFPGQPPAYNNPNDRLGSPSANVPSANYPVANYLGPTNPASGLSDPSGGVPAAAGFNNPAAGVVTGGAFAFNGNIQAGQNISGGIAGVASTVEREGIKIYKEKSKYNQWEFIYDFAGENKAAQAVPSGPVPGTSSATSGGGFNSSPQPGPSGPIKP